MKLYYFDMPGRGESIRLLLTHAKVKFEDVRIPFKDWLQYKPQFELHQLPVLEVEPGKRLTQSYAIMEYLGAKYGYLPKDYADFYTCLFVMNTFDDILMKAIKSVAPPPVSYVSEEGRKDMIEKIKATEGKLAFGAIEKRLKENKTQNFIIGKKHTIADFALLGFYMHVVAEPKYTELLLPIIKEFPVLYNYLEKRRKEFNTYYHKCDHKLYYFTTPGRAEMTRILFRYLRIPFEDVRYTQDQWKDEKKSGKFELEQLPTLICDPCGEKLSQSDAIIQSLGVKFGLFPTKNPDKIYKVTWVCHTVKDMIDQLVSFVFSSIPEDTKKVMRKEYFEKKAPVFLEALENCLKLNKSQSYFVGRKFTIADFSFVGMLRGLIFSPAFPEYPEVFNKFPTLVKFYEEHKDL